MGREPDPREARAPSRHGRDGVRRRREVVERLVRPALARARLTRILAAALALTTSAACAAGCGPASTRPVEAAPQRARWDGALVDLVPEHATVVLVARPERLMSEPAVRRVVDAIASDEQLERYRQHTGIDPRRLDELVWASTDSGTVLVVRGPFSAPLAVAEMAYRMLPVEASSDAPYVRRVGHYQGARRDLVALSDDVLVAITGPPSLAEAVFRRAERPGASVLAGEPIASLRAAHEGAPFIVVAPRPLGLPVETPVGLLLARQRGLFLAASASGPDSIGLVAELGGEFPPGADENFRALANSLAESDLGDALGIRAALPTLVVQSDAERVSLRATFSARTVAAGLHVLFGAEIAEIVEPPAEHRPAGTESSRLSP